MAFVTSGAGGPAPRAVEPERLDVLVFSSRTMVATVGVVETSEVLLAEDKRAEVDEMDERWDERRPN